ncbi:MAG: MBL fold metallo-hydrolase [Pseudomonadota bacterium]
MKRGLIIEAICRQPRILRLTEACIRPQERSYFYLIETTSRSCLIDSGWGLGWTITDLPLHVSDRPVTAIATHSHVDHIGRLAAFPDRLAHAEELAVYAAPDHEATQAWPYLEDRPLLNEGDGQINLSTYKIAPAPLTGTLSDGDVIDLTEARLEVVYTPGHSPGSISLRCPEADLLFTADALHAGPIYDNIPGASRAQLLKSHERLSSLDFAYAAPGHGPMLNRAQALARMTSYRDLCGSIRLPTNASLT